MSPTHPPIKDEAGEPHPIPECWRSTIQQIVRAFVEHDYALSRGIPSVTLEAADTPDQIRDYIRDSGHALAELPVESWDTSVALWMDPHWDVFVDLWTADSGNSDLVLQLRAFDEGDHARFEVYMVYVP